MNRRDAAVMVVILAASWVIAWAGITWRPVAVVTMGVAMTVTAWLGFYAWRTRHEP